MLKTFFNYFLFGVVCSVLIVCMLFGFIFDSFKYLATIASKGVWSLANIYLDKLIAVEIQLKKFKKGVDKMKKM